MTRNITIDVCKGLGIMLVVLGHLPTILGGAIYLFHMPFFFMLGGYVFKTSYLDEPLNFLKKKLISLVLPAYLFKGIVFLIGRFGPWQNFNMFIEEYHILGTLWFLTALFKAAVITFCLLYILRLLKKKSLWIPLIIIAIAAFSFSLCGFSKLATTFYITAFYFLGYIIKMKYSTVIKLQTVSYKSIMVMLTFLLIILGLHSKMPLDIIHATYYNFVQYFFISLMGSYIALQLSAYIGSKHVIKDIFVIVGQNTMPIVLFQWSAFCLVDILLKYNYIEISNNSILIIDKFLAGLVMPMIVYFFYKMIKQRIIKHN